VTELLLEFFMDKFAKIIAILALFLVAAMPAQAVAQTGELGLTPSPVYGLWRNINKAVMAYGRLYIIDEAWLGKLEDMEPNKFSEKIPADVLELVERFDAKLNELNELKGHKKRNVADSLLDGSLPHLLSTDVSRITPSHVFLRSGQLLINISGSILIESTAAVVISPFFEEHKFSGKTPSDVFGLVDRALRRLDKISVRLKSDQLRIRDGSR
jgi:hypothetical protein